MTGLSGAGKSVAIKVLEDLGYYTLDNLPPALIVPLGLWAFHQADRHVRIHGTIAQH